MPSCFVVIEFCPWFDCDWCLINMWPLLSISFYCMHFFRFFCLWPVISPSVCRTASSLGFTLFPAAYHFQLNKRVCVYTCIYSVGVGRMFASVCLFVCLSVCLFLRRITYKRMIPKFSNLVREWPWNIPEMMWFGVERSKVKVTGSINAFSH